MSNQAHIITLAALFTLGSAVPAAFAQSAPASSTNSATAAAAAKPKPMPLVPPSLASYQGAPFGGKAQTIPGRIEVENFDEGGHGIAYYDRTPDVNSGAGYRKGEGVDIKGMVLPPGRKPWYKSNESTPTVGWFFVGEWMHYTVEVTLGVYDINVRYATPIADKAIDIHLDGVLLASVPTPKTGEYTIWKTTTFKNVKIEASGRHLLRVQAAGRDLDEDDINWIEFVQANP